MELEIAKMAADITLTHLLLGASSLIITIGSAWLTLRKIIKDIRRERSHDAAKILQDAKEASNAKYIELKNRVDNLEKDMEKDLGHLKETYNGALSNLGQKIEELRSELRNQHGQLVGLLSEMIKKD